MIIISFSLKRQWSLCLCAFMAEGRAPCFSAPSVYTALHASLTDAIREFPSIWHNVVLVSQIAWLHFFFFCFFLLLFTHTPKESMWSDFPSHLNYKSLFCLPQHKPFWVWISLFLFCLLVDIHENWVLWDIAARTECWLFERTSEKHPENKMNIPIWQKIH